MSVFAEALFVAVACAVPKDVPPLFGTEMRPTVETWESVRRPALLETFTREQFGRRSVEAPPELVFSSREPDECLPNGLGVKRKMRMTCGNGRGGRFDVSFTAYLPADAKRAPTFLLIAPHDPDHVGERVNERRPHRLDVTALLSRGYAAIAYKNDDVAADRPYEVGRAMTNGVFAVFGPKGVVDRPADAWGAVSAWAWGASRVMDWIVSQEEFDSSHVAVVGLSRCGKTALWAGATDSRFALVISCCSGCSGAKLNHMDLPKSEHLEQINANFPHWFCGNYRAWNGREAEMPFDQHQLLALIAPRLAYVASATEDAWAGQPGEFVAARIASPAWELYGQKGLVGGGDLKPESPLHEGSVGHHMRIGPHDQTAYDWACYMDFAERHGWHRHRRLSIK